MARVPTTSRTDAAPAEDQHHRNDVSLVGRLAAPAQERALPSGDRIVTFRLIVDRAHASGARRGTSAPEAPSGPRVDTLDCVVWTPGLRRQVASWRAGDVIEVAGALRRRFWRAAGGPVSRCEVEVFTARRVRRAG